MREVPESELKKRLRFDNSWWDSGEVDERYRNWPRRAYFAGFTKLVTETSVQRAVVLMGPRRVGKTVMIQQLIQQLLDGNIPSVNILYVSVDTPVYTGLALETLLRLFQEIHNHDRNSNLFVFFDEIQYLPDWEVHLKSLVDSYPDMRFIASGSAAAALKMKSQESGAGRFTEFVLPPLTFFEFLRFQDLENSFIEFNSPGMQIKDIEGLNEQFINFLNFGGFPEAVTEEKVRQDLSRYVANDIIDKVLLRDLPSLYGINDSQELNRLFTVLAYNSGQEMTLDGLSQSSNVSKNTIKKYLDYLEAAFLICRLDRVDQNATRFKKQTHFKMYLTNPSIRAALFGPIGADDPAMGLMAETAIISQYAQSLIFDNLYFARWKNGEVDIVWTELGGKSVFAAIEVKWSDRAYERPTEELGALIKFCKGKNLKTRCIVTTRTLNDFKTIDEIEMWFLPTAALCYRDGKMMIENTLLKGFHPLSAIALGEKIEI